MAGGSLAGPNDALLARFNTSHAPTAPHATASDRVRYRIHLTPANFASPGAGHGPPRESRQCLVSHRRADQSGAENPGRWDCRGWDSLSSTRNLARGCTAGAQRWACGDCSASPWPSGADGSATRN